MDQPLKKPFGPRIVRAWFDTVFRAVFQSLEDERGFLQRRNWTFRSRTNSLEYIGSIDDHLSAGARENLEQFVSFYPNIEDAIRQHDSAAKQLEASCQRYCKALIRDEAFRKTFHKIASVVSPPGFRNFEDYFGGHSSEENRMGLLAEYIVNNIDYLPDHYITAELWNTYGSEFEPVESNPEIVLLHDVTHEAGRRLIESVETLKSMLKSTRSDLSLEFDVPYVTELAHAS